MKGNQTDPKNTNQPIITLQTQQDEDPEVKPFITVKRVMNKRLDSMFFDDDGENHTEDNSSSYVDEVDDEESHNSRK